MLRCITGGHADQAYRLVVPLMLPCDSRCLVFLPSGLIAHPHPLLDRCDLSESLGETTLLPLTLTLDNVFTKKTRLHCLPPRRRLFAGPISNILFPLLHVFRDLVEIIYALFSFLLSSRTLWGDGIHHPNHHTSSAGWCLRTGTFY